MTKVFSSESGQNQRGRCDSKKMTLRHPSKKGSLGNHSNRRKHISFDPRGNRVRFVPTPPKSEYKNYWFSESQHVVRKGIQIEVEQDIAIALNVECRLQLTSLTQASTPSNGPHSNSRVFLEVKELSLSSLGEVDEESWYCVGSVCPGSVEKICVVLPAGLYHMRSVGKNPIHVFAQMWEVERELQ
ncbi:unnamed protein product [Phytomonas sp. EM1]|nr:unnamed protein product [Phytomonas sp. EM1]|eukprot:CCW62381.1 unnamed protein product [Phytomonas sp. isolate EM1]